MAETAHKREPANLEAIVDRYLRRCQGNPVRALHEAVAHALEDFSRCERQSEAKDRQSSRGYVRSDPSSKQE